MMTAVLTDVVPLGLHAVKLAVSFALRALQAGAAVAGYHDLMQARRIIRKTVVEKS